MVLMYHGTYLLQASAAIFEKSDHDVSAYAKSHSHARETDRTVNGGTRRLGRHIDHLRQQASDDASHMNLRRIEEREPPIVDIS